MYNKKNICLLLSSIFLWHTALIGMNEINHPKRDILSHYVVVNNECTRAFIHNYYNRKYCIEAERYIACADFDLKENKLSSYEIYQDHKPYPIEYEEEKSCSDKIYTYLITKEE